jgi:hypothetical protein
MKEDPPPDAKCRDKFLVQSVLVTADKEFANVASLVRITSSIMWDHGLTSISGRTSSRRQSHQSRSGRLGSFSSQPMMLALRRRRQRQMESGTKTSARCTHPPHPKPSPLSVALPNNPSEPSRARNLVPLIARTLVRLANLFTILQTLASCRALGQRHPAWQAPFPHLRQKFKPSWRRLRLRL